MASLEKFKQIICDFSDKADFVIVYIEEAHAAEKGHFTGSNKITSYLIYLYAI